MEDREYSRDTGLWPVRAVSMGRRPMSRGYHQSSILPFLNNLLIHSSLSRGLEAEKGKTCRGKNRRTRFNVSCVCLTLFTQTQPADDLLVSRAIGAGQILQQMVSLADHLEQPAAR